MSTSEACAQDLDLEMFDQHSTLGTPIAHTSSSESVLHPKRVVRQWLSSFATDGGVDIGSNVMRRSILTNVADNSRGGTGLPPV